MEEGGLVGGQAGVAVEKRAHVVAGKASLQPAVPDDEPGPREVAGTAVTDGAMIPEPALALGDADEEIPDRLRLQRIGGYMVALEEGLDFAAGSSAQEPAVFEHKRLLRQRSGVLVASAAAALEQPMQVRCRGRVRSGRG